MKTLCAKTGFTLSLLALAISSQAQDDGGDFSLEDLLATGFRASLIKAIEAKRQAIGSQDTVVAEDIADFPDLNLAESVQRMPGATITREVGEGRQLSLRGVGPAFTRVQINGMETIAKTSSAMDSRGAVRRDRYFDFNVFASEMFSQINIYKSVSADLDEGGIGGTIGLETAKPLDFDETKFVVSGSVGTNEFTEEINPRLNAFYTTQFGIGGVLASFFYSEKDTQEKGVNTFRYRPRTLTVAPGGEGDIGSGIDSATQTLLENGDVWFPRGNRYSVWENTQERIGLNLALQLQPIDEFTLSITGLYAELNNDRDEYHLSTNGSSSTALGIDRNGTPNAFGAIESIETRNIGGDIELISGTFSNAPIRTEHRTDQADTTYNQIVFDVDWEFAEGWMGSAMLGYSKSEFDQPVSDKAYFRTIQGQTFTSDYSNREYAQFDYGFDLTDASFWEVQEVDLREDYFEDEFTNLKFDFEYEFTDVSTLSFGLNYKLYENVGDSVRANDFGSRQDAPLNNGVRDVAPFFSIYSESDDESFPVAGNVNAVASFYGVNTDLDFGDDFDEDFVEEETLGLYIQYTLDTEVAGLPVKADAGLRYYDTDATYSTAASGSYEFDHSYDGVLPSFNLAVEVFDDFIVRGSVSQNISRPFIQEARITEGQPRYRFDTGDRVITMPASPELDPFESDNFELSAEWYFGGADFISVGFFTKDITGFTDLQTDEVAYGSIGLPLDLLPDDQDASTIYTFSRLVNSEEADITGIEVTVQKEFDFLPEPFNGMGMVANLTSVEGDATYRDVKNSGEKESKSFPGLSELSYNFTLYYEQETWGGRVAFAYRDEYIDFVEPGLADEDERGFKDTLYVDFSAFYQINDRMKITLEGINLTDEEERQYSNSTQRLYQTTTFGATYNLGLSYSFM
ncbi:TonB-dependent receptor [Marinibactrum halimedae]|uniref:TonB-dependent receptor n=1 Tax=Marinibactrum halimedae TaxID=1444977 RepID=A0AA37TDT9_9GAMM|nr:TonB-dependent receptor [Marinibactrum halimedae]MCD9459225.1 TonB-dependent receptor [Marinibactrum halimedae]GLS27297.1 TonB-dependent receptor [Marinibactrum halimedae]